ncbi:MAG: proline dehydrogenase family protein [Saprospiraceae bacterium]
MIVTKQNKEVDFSDSLIAFKGQSDKELKRTAFLFRLMNYEWLVNISTTLGLYALKLRLPFVKPIMAATIVKQFIGGLSLRNCAPTITKLATADVFTILDYGAEGKDIATEFVKTKEENIAAIHFAKKNRRVPIITAKVSGFGRNALLEKFKKGEPYVGDLQLEYNALVEKIDAVCLAAHKNDVGVFIDAEESWIQDAIDDIATLMMQRYNQEKVIVYNTFQMYRKDRYAYLVAACEDAKAGNYLLGAKLVRGAYMEKERSRAEKMDYPTPIQDNKAATDADFNKALKFCFEQYETIGFCNATHNQQSCQLLIRLIEENQVAKNHPHLLFCQLYGMSDNITFNLSNAGYNAAKYVPYGPIEDVFPYLVRRAQENTAVSGEMSREYGLLLKEIARRNS